MGFLSRWDKWQNDKRKYEAYLLSKIRKQCLEKYAEVQYTVRVSTRFHPQVVQSTDNTTTSKLFLRRRWSTYGPCRQLPGPSAWLPVAQSTDFSFE